MYIRKLLMLALCVPFVGCATKTAVEKNNGTLRIARDGKVLLEYRFQPLANPRGGERFAGSNFIHPLKTPSGVCITGFQPDDHLHHFGLWWPWKMIRVDGREIITWELQKGEGLVQAREAAPTDAGFMAESDYIDRTAPDGPLVILKEEARVAVADFAETSANGYYLDISISQRCATDRPVEISKYRYSGFSIRATPEWNKDNSTILTSAGKGRYDANFTRACWIQAEGAVPDSGTAGFIIMGHPGNHSHPELLRTWDTQHDGAVFINFNPVQQASWHLQPGGAYTRRYRLFVYDGELDTTQIAHLWEEYENEQ
jgi:hypothetical protein